MLEYIYTRFLIYYLDDIYTRLFSLSGDNEEYDEDIYFQYLRIRAELHNINHYTYKDGNKDYHGIFTVVKIYEKDRYKWTGNYLEEFIPSLRTDKKGLQNVYERLLAEHNTLHHNFKRTIMLSKKLDVKPRTAKVSIKTQSMRKTQKQRTVTRKSQKKKSQQTRKSQKKLRSIEEENMNKYE